MYQCTRCRAPVSRPQQLCESCQATHAEEDEERSLEDFDTILNIRGPQDVRALTGGQPTLLAAEKTPETVGIILDSHDVTSSQHTVRAHRNVVTSLSPPRLLSTKDEPLDDDYQLLGDQTLDIDTQQDEMSIDDVDFDDSATSMRTEISDFSPMPTSRGIFEAQTTPSVSSGTPSLGPSALRSTLPGPSADKSKRSQASSRQATERASTVSPRPSEAPTPSAQPSQPSSPPPVPPPSPSLGGWRNIPNPFAPPSNVKPYSRHDYHIIDLTHDPIVAPLKPEDQLPLKNVRLTWRPTETTTSYQLSPQRLNGRSPSVAIWRPLVKRGGQPLQLDQIYRYGEWCFIVRPFAWPKGMMNSTDSASTPLALMLYQDQTRQTEGVHDSDRDHLLDRDGLRLRPQGLFPLSRSGALSVGYSAQCDVVLPTRVEQHQSSDSCFTLTTSMNPSEVLISGDVWRLISPLEEIPFGSVITSEQRLFCIVSI